MPYRQPRLVVARCFPPKHPAAMAVDAVPHYRMHEAADGLKALAAVELGDTVGELVAGPLQNPTLADGDVTFAAGRAEARIGGEPREQIREVVRRQFQVGVQLADEVVLVQVRRGKSLVKGFNDAWAHPPRGAGCSMNHLDPGVFARRPGGTISGGISCCRR